MNKPMEITLPEWKEILNVPEIKAMWGGMFNESVEDFIELCYGVKFDFHGCMNYVGDLFVVMGDGLAIHPAVLIRNYRTGGLKLVKF